MGITMRNPNQKYRIEQDSIGTMEVPIEAYYAVQSLLAMQNFPISGRGLHEEFNKCGEIKKGRSHDKQGGGEPGDYRLVHPNDHVNIAQSTNDVIPTAGKITVLKLARCFCGYTGASP